MITIEYNLAYPDLVAMARCYYATLPMIKRKIRYSQFSLTFTFAAVSCSGFLTAQIFFGIVFGVLAVWAAFGYPAWYRSTLIKHAGEIYRLPEVQKLLGKYTLTLSEDGISVISPVAESKMKWEALSSAVLTKDHLFVYITVYSGYAIPRSQVPDAKIEEVKRCLDAHLPPPVITG